MPINSNSPGGGPGGNRPFDPPENPYEAAYNAWLMNGSQGPAPQPEDYPDNFRQKQTVRRMVIRRRRLIRIRLDQTTTGMV